MFQPSEEQALLRDAVDGFFRDRAASVLSGYDAEGWGRMARDLDVLAAPFPEELGGAGGCFADAAILLEMMGEHLVVQPYLDTVVMAGRAIATSEHRGRGGHVTAIGRGEMIVALAWREAGRRDDPLHVEARAVPEERGGYRIQGCKLLVRFAAAATHFLISARIADSGEPALWLVPADAPGIVRETARGIDGADYATIRFEHVAVAPDALIVAEAAAALVTMLREGEAGLCAEAVGIMRAMLALTLEHAGQRQQFGAPLSSFQTLQHRIVDMRIAIEHATSIAKVAAAAIDGASPDAGLLVAAARYVCGDALGRVAREAVQIHGAIGLMEETPLSRYFRRSLVLQGQLHGAQHHLDAIAAQAGATIPEGRDGDDLVGRLVDDPTGAVAAFRAEVRGFLDEALTPELRAGAAWETGAFAKADLSQPWLAALNARGWAAPGWPQEHGGPGWSPRQRQVFEEEVARAGAPRLPAMAFAMAAPVIMRFGTAEQKAHFLPRILSGEDYWCQGFSEPGAGSDLAALQLRADRDGDDYILNGSKIWTTFAHFANWIFVLARTSQEERRQQGISFLLIPMDSPGITVTPLISMSGEHEVNQIFFDDVRVPAAHRVGPEGEGWTVARYLLEFERGVGHQVQALVAELGRLRTIARGEALWQEESFRRRYAELEAWTLAIRLTEERLVYALPSGQSVGDFTASLMKLSWSEMGQRIDGMALEALGPFAAIDQGPAVESRDPARIFGPGYGATVTRRYLDNRVMTIAGGSSEIQRTILARLILSGRA